jgi:hypothetical protein
MNAPFIFRQMSVAAMLALLSETTNAQCMDGNCNNGYGTYRYANGDTYTGQWRQNAPHGTGKYIFKRSRQHYEGQFSQGKISGKGTMYFSDGSVYQGQWSDNTMNGSGAFTTPFGQVKKGTWANGNLVEPSDYQRYVVENTRTEHRVTASPFPLKNPVRVFAVIVGVSRYQSSTLARIQYADDDADSVRAHLQRLMTPADYRNQVLFITNERATRDEIMAGLKRQFVKADENDVILFYFSGHGLRGAFLPVDYDGASRRVTHQDLQGIFQQSKAKHKICIADACFSGALSAKGGGSGTAVALQPFYKAFENAQGGTALLLSSRPEQESFEDPQLRHGVFTFYLLQGLCGEADLNEDQIVNIRELYNYVLPRVWNYTDGAQSPMLTGDYDASIPMGIILR